MAYGKNTGIQYRPLQGDISTDILNNEDQEFKYRAEERLTKAQLDAEKKAADEKLAKRKEALGDLYVKPSGYKSHDEPLIEILQGKNGVYEQWSNLQDQIEKDPQNTKLLAKQVMLEKSIENLKGLRDGMVARGQDAQAGIDSLKYSPELNKGFTDNYNKLIKDFQYNYKIKDSGEIVIENKGYDPDKDGIPNELSLQDVWDPEKMKLQGYFDPKKWAVSTKEEFGKFDKTTDNGVTSHRLVGFDPTKADALLARVEADFGNSLETMTGKAKSYINDTLKLDYNDMTEAKFKEVRADFANRVKHAYDKIDTTNVTPPTGGGDSDDDKTGGTGITFLEETRGDDGALHTKRYSFNTPYVIKGTNNSGKPATLSEIRYDATAKSSQIILIGKAFEGEETTTVDKEEETFSVDGDQAKEGKTKTTTANKKDKYGYLQITDKAEVTAILKKYFKVDSYAEIVKILRGEEEKKESKAEVDEYGVPIVKN